MRLISALMLGLIAFALASPWGAASPQPECGMACCRLAAHHHTHPSCASAAICKLTSCGQRGTAAGLPSLPLSMLAAPPRLGVPTAAGPLASLPPPGTSSLPQALLERPPRA